MTTKRDLGKRINDLDAHERWVREMELKFCDRDQTIAGRVKVAIKIDDLRGLIDIARASLDHHDATWYAAGTEGETAPAVEAALKAMGAET